MRGAQADMAARIVRAVRSGRTVQFTGSLWQVPAGDEITARATARGNRGHDRAQPTHEYRMVLPDGHVLPPGTRDSIRSHAGLSSRRARVCLIIVVCAL